MKKEKKIQTIVNKGVPIELAQKVVEEGFTYTKISKRTKGELVEIFGEIDGELLYKQFVRQPISKKIKEEIFERSKGVCCVCRIRGLGINYHHIDEDPTNNSLENIAILCVKDHDKHHRYSEYDRTNHTELTQEEIKKHKTDWEWFVKEATELNPKVLAVINIYGNEEVIHSMRFFMQDIEGKIIYERISHLHTKQESWIDKALDDINFFGKKIPLTVIDKPLEIEYCPCGCNNSMTNILDSNVALKITTPDWEEKSIASIYINPKQTSLAILISYNQESIYQASIHKCTKDIIGFHSTNYNEQIPISKKPSIRTQVAEVVQKVIDSWEPGFIFIGTGNPDNPDLIEEFILPRIWEKRN